MKRWLLGLLLCVPALAQTASYPGAVVTDNQLRVGVNNVTTTLAAPMASTDTTFTVASGTGIVANTLATINNEVVAVCGVAANVVQVGKSTCPNVDGRGFDSSIATTHATGATVSLFIDAWHHNAMKAEVEAVETALGANMANVPGSPSGGNVPVNKGGTGAATASAALTNLGAPGLTANNTFGGNNTFNGNDTTSGTNTHSGSETFTGPVQAGGATSTRPNRSSTGSPSGRDACSNLGETYFQTDATAGQNIWLCTGTGTPGTWTQVTSGGTGLPTLTNELSILQIAPNTAGGTGGTRSAQWYDPRVYLRAQDFVFGQFPSGTLTASVPATVTLSPVPLGINGTDSGHWLYISVCSGGAQAVLITGGTATSGAASGTITFTPTNSCSVGWGITTASGGIQEAAVYANSTGQVVQVAQGTVDLFAPVTFGASTTGLIGTGPNAAILTAHFLTGDVLIFNNAGWFRLENLLINATSQRTTGAMAHFTLSNPVLYNVSMNDAYIGVMGDGTAANMYLINTYIFASYRGVDNEGMAAYYTNLQVQGTQSSGTVITGSAAVYLHSASAGKIVNFQHDSGSFNYCLQVDNFNDVALSNSYCDNYTVVGLIVTGAGADLSGRWVVSNARFIGNGLGAGGVSGTGVPCIQFQSGNDNNWTLNGIHCATTAASATAGIEVAATQTDLTISNSHIYGIGSGSSGTGVHIASGSGAKRIRIVGNEIGLGVEGAQLATGVLQESTGGDLTIVGNSIHVGTTAVNLSISSPFTNFVIANNNGIDTTTPAVASTGNLGFPVAPNFTVTGTTGVTSILNAWPGKSGVFITTDGAVAFSSSATIGNSCTTTQNKPYTYFTDAGSKTWIAGSGC